MKFITLISKRFILVVVGLVFLVGLSACGDYKVAITERPTRRIDERLIGSWIPRTGAERIKVRPLNESTYVVSYSGLLFRAFHSDLAGVSFINAQDLETTEGKYFYLTYRLSDDGKRLYLRVVDDRVIPATTKDSTTVQKLLRDNLQNPELLGTEGEYLKEP
jgi:hypothetical protein